MKYKEEVILRIKQLFFLVMTTLLYLMSIFEEGNISSIAFGLGTITCIIVFIIQIDIINIITMRKKKR